MWIIFKLLILVLLHIRNGNTNSVFQSRITGIKYPEPNPQNISCDCNKTDCESINCELCLYAKLFNWDDIAGRPNYLIARAQIINNTLIDEFKLTILNSFPYDFNSLHGLAIFVNKCSSGNAYIVVDMFIHNYLDSRFFTKCNYCRGFYRNYRLGGILLNNENLISRTKGFSFEITYIEFMHQKLQNGQCCTSELKNTLDNCSVCKFWIRMEYNNLFVSDSTIIEFDSFIPQHKLNYRFFFNLPDMELRPLKVKFVFYQRQLTDVIDSFGPFQLDSYGYYKNKYTENGTASNVKANFSYTMTPIEYMGGNGNYMISNDQPTGTTFNLDGSARCADPTLLYQSCDNDKNVISYCNLKQPCQNNGICSGTLSSYKCKCKVGFKGKNCELFYCSKPCVTGKCTSGNLCGLCDPGYGGNGCRDKVCDGYNKCANGKCSIGSNNERYCECSANYSGNYCQYNCYLPCVQGVCKFSNGISFCLCNFGWNGVLCNSHSESTSEIFHASRNFLILIVIIPVIVFGLIILISFLILKVVHVKVNRHNDELHDKILTLLVNSQNNDNLKSTSAPILTAINQNRSLIENKNPYGSIGVNYKVYEDFSLNLPKEKKNFNKLPEHINDKGLNNDLTDFYQQESNTNAEIGILGKL